MPYEEIMTNNQARQRDIVLAPNEFVFVESKTDGQVKTYTGPMTITISGQEALMIFDEETKQFIETSHLEDAKQLFCSPPENWYVVLKNPAKDNTHPEPRKAVFSPELVAAMTTKANASLTETIAKSLAPYALASEDESTSDVVNKLLRGLPLENVITGIAEIKNN